MEDKDIIAASDLRKTSSTDPQLAQIARDLSDMGRRLQEIASTISSKSQETTQSSGRYRNGQNHTRSSNPTSYSSHPLHFGDRKSPESDLEVQHGSSDHLCPESSSELSLSSEDPRKDLPLPSTQDRIRNVGQHLPDLIQHPAAAAALQPHTDEEARAVMDRRNRATATNHAAEAFESHLQPEPTPELDIQREQISSDMAICWPIRRAHLFAGPDDDSRIIDAALDEEDQEEEQESYCGSNDKRISTLAFFLIVAIAFFAVSFELYQRYGLRIEA